MCRLCQVKPEQANFEIGPESDLVNFLSVHLKKPYSVNITEPHKPGDIHHRGGNKVRISYSCHEWINVNLTIVSTGISNE